jgi:uncharacterized protein (TIGR03382 family)
VSGTVVVPVSDGGWQRGPSALRVRVEGTSVEAPVVPTAADAGAFELGGVPQGRVTLVLVEGPVVSQWPSDAFTHASKRVAVDVGPAGASGVTFPLVHHWREIASYPPPYAIGALWEAQFVSSTAGFMYFRAGGDPEVRSLWRTLDAGATWDPVGTWTADAAAWARGEPYPAFPAFHFSDADHGVVQAEVFGLPCNPTAGFLSTSNGGATWSLAPLQMPGSAYWVGFGPFAHAGRDLLLAAGQVGCGVQGYVSGHHDAIWESVDAGATWALARSWPVTYGTSRGCTGLGAGPSGAALAFFTPDDLSERVVARRTAAGAWTSAQDASLVVSNPGDVSWAGDRVWVSNVNGTREPGFYRSDDGGVTFSLLLPGGTPAIHSFATAEVGYVFGGNVLHATADGGVTWAAQAVGGDTCCHGPWLWAFEGAAFWKEGIFGDPNSRTQLFRLAEPPVAAFEVLPGAALADATARPGDRAVAVLPFRLRNTGGVPLLGFRLAVRAAGTGDDAQDVSLVQLWYDPEGDGSVGRRDVPLAEAAFGADDGRAVLAVPPPGLDPGQTVALLVGYDLAPSPSRGGTFTASLAALDVGAETATSAIPVASSGSRAATWAGRTITAMKATPGGDGGGNGGGGGGCGCGGGSGGLAALALLVALLRSRRRP